jgi:hypothetical protein
VSNGDETRARQNLYRYSFSRDVKVVCVKKIRTKFAKIKKLVTVHQVTPSRYISGDSMSSLLLFYHADNILLPNPAWW